MSYPINYPTPQGANVQIFNAPTNSASNWLASWTKPQGASFVWFTLIGNGGIGNGTTGGGSGAVTNFMCPAFLIPDRLAVKVGTTNSNDTVILYQEKNTTGYTLLQANGTVGISAAAATAANAFTAMGFYQSVAGQAGASGNPATPTTTFLQAGGGAASGAIGNYGYVSSSDGFFQMQPIICTVGASNGANPATAGIGGGGTRSTSSTGGPGMVVIITW